MKLLANQTVVGVKGLPCFPCLTKRRNDAEQVQNALTAGKGFSIFPASDDSNGLVFRRYVDQLDADHIANSRLLDTFQP